jgi:hypothetical protein
LLGIGVPRDAGIVIWVCRLAKPGRFMDAKRSLSSAPAGDASAALKARLPILFWSFSTPLVVFQGARRKAGSLRPSMILRAGAAAPHGGEWPHVSTNEE